MPTSLYKRTVKRSLPVRTAIGRIIPDALSIRARKAFGLRPVIKVDLKPLELIRSSKLGDLRDPSYLEHTLLPKLGLHGEARQVFPESLHPFLGRGLRHWQYPNQLSRYLVYLSTQRIETYLEIGVQYGGTFAITVEYLRRFHPLRCAYAVDTNRVPSLREYSRLNPVVQLLRKDSSSKQFQRFVQTYGPFDLVFVDGDHEEEGVRSDWNTVSRHARIVALHDIVDDPCPGVRRVWSELTTTAADKFEFIEFTAQYPEIEQRLGHSLLGIGLAVRRSDSHHSLPR